jgi:tRNA 2-selenouridine synthase
MLYKNRLNMPTEIDSAAPLPAKDFWRQSRGETVLDVRSPGEFQKGHIPGAINLPLFDDEQRATIGTIYKNSGRDDAVLRGLAFVGPKLAELAKFARHRCTGSKAFVHCWRGGMRSQSMKWLLDTAGLTPRILDGGYKSFRQLAHNKFEEPAPLRVISGLTGAGKTRVLDLLTAAGEHVIDLEGLANHRGSAFGSIGQPNQPTTEQFENDLFAELDRCRNAERIWIEDEGNRLGGVVVPPPFIQHLKDSPAIFLESSPAKRVEYLMIDYGDLDPQLLIASVQMIRKRLGFDLAEEASQAIQAGNIKRAIEIVLAYYDRTYLHAAAKHTRTDMQNLAIDDLADQQIVDQLLALASK